MGHETRCSPCDTPCDSNSSRVIA
ncbi:MAG: hypothetical protein HOJ55_03630 [Euryarchaeota archaeon]|nr:hypothetical protein [Euryarchaeota archaeon]